MSLLTTTSTPSALIMHAARQHARGLPTRMLSSRRMLSYSSTLYYGASASSASSCSLGASTSAALGNIGAPGTKRRASKLAEPAKVERRKGGSIESPHFRDHTVHEIVTKHDHAPSPSAGAPGAPGATASPAAVTGDWVLFHPVYTEEENHSVQVLVRPSVTTGDRAARVFSRLLRWGFDLASRYKHKEIPAGSQMTLEELQKGGYVMTEGQWLARILFLESIAGVPGMVAATVRHLRSLRSMKRDNAWIHTLLQEAENERMHLMSFMTIKKPGWFFRLMILGAQGVFYNLFFGAYLLKPATCHRFVGYLEEEAVYTYTNLIKALEAGQLPGWEKMPAPAIAIEYWRLPQDAKLIDMIYAVRSDETTHRFVNHSLASLKPEDVNPFAMGEPPMTTKGTKIAFEREDSIEYITKGQEELAEARKTGTRRV